MEISRSKEIISVWIVKYQIFHDMAQKGAARETSQQDWKGYQMPRDLMSRRRQMWQTT